MEGKKDKAEWIENCINDFIANSPDNTLQDKENSQAFESALVGFSCGSDPLYEAYKEHVGPFFITPEELFNVTFRDVKTNPEELTVISWILPLHKDIKKDNRKERKWPSEKWARGRIYGEVFNEMIRSHVVSSLTSKGYKAIAPFLSPQFSVRISPKYGYSSTWSERHAAFAAGLGTFGLCDGLITAKGKAMRCGSVIAQIDIMPTPRPYKNHNEYCLFFSHGICGKCIERCPANAISAKGKDKQLCFLHLNPGSKEYLARNFQLDGYGCGLCQTKVPCESQIPAP